MSILKFLGLERPDSQLEDTGTDTETVQRILAELDCLEPDRARYLAAFAYVLGEDLSDFLINATHSKTVYEQQIKF